jgi:hypothetical protein
VASLATVGTGRDGVCWVCGIAPAGVLINHLVLKYAGVLGFQLTIPAMTCYFVVLSFNRARTPELELELELIQTKIAQNLRKTRGPRILSPGPWDWD